jgi:hypothetical protein
MSFAAWMSVRKTALLSIGLGTASWIIALMVAWKVWPDVVEPPNRLQYAVQLLAPISVLVLLMVSACFRVFDTDNAEDPFANAESAAWKVNQRVLSNTVEQSLIFIPALLALSVRVDAQNVRILPILTALWCSGRLLFWVGYRVHPMWRGPGFEWTLFSSLTALGWFGWSVLAA